MTQDRPAWGPARASAVVVLVVTVVGSLLPWTVGPGPGTRGSEYVVWASGAVPAAGATLAVAGAVASVVGALLRRRPVVLAGTVVAVAGAAFLLAWRYRPTSPSGYFSTGGFEYADEATHLVDLLPSAPAWVAAGGLAALATAVAARPTGGVRRATAVVAGVVGAVLVVVGASVFPWALDSGTGRGPVGASLWRAGTDARVGAVATLLAAVVLVVAARWPRRGVTVAAAVVAALGLGAVLAERLPNPWERSFGWYAYQPLEAVTLPASWEFQAATTLVLLGAVLVLGAALVGVHGRSARAG